MISIIQIYQSAKLGNGEKKQLCPFPNVFEYQAEAKR